MLTTVEKHQFQQKKAHDNTKPLVSFTKGETVLVRSHKGAPKWIAGRILRQKGPVSYLVQVDSRVRYCHVDHLLKRNVIPLEETQAAPEKTRQTEISDFFFPEDSDVEVNEDPLDTSVAQRHSTRTRQPPRRLIEEINNYIG